MADNSTPAEWLYSSVDCGTNITTVYAGPCLLRQVTVTSVLSAHALLILDNATRVSALPASSAAGTRSDCGDVRVETKLIVDPDDSATGTVAVVYKPFHDGAAGSGYSGG